MRESKSIKFPKETKKLIYLDLLIKKTYNILGIFTSRIFAEFNEINYPRLRRYNDLIKSYDNSGISTNRNFHIEKLNRCLKYLKLPKYNEDFGMYSEHLIIFAALSSTINPKRILEIGTYDGKTAAILAYLFPNSEITTIDLRDDDSVFKSTYNRHFNLKHFSKRRNAILKKFKNIKFIQCNSLELTLNNIFKKQDLIWVDGAHGYPTATIDITNSIRLLKKNGIFMCDDVWKNLRKNDSMYKSNASYETLNAFSELKIIKTNFFRKRIGKKYNGNYKYVSFSKIQ